MYSDVRQTDRQRDKQTRHTDRHRQTDARRQRQTDTDRQTQEDRDRQTGTPTDRQTHRQTDRQTDTETDRQTHKQTRQTDRHRDRQTDMRLLFMQLPIRRPLVLYYRTQNRAHKLLKHSAAFLAYSRKITKILVTTVGQIVSSATPNLQKQFHYLVKPRERLLIYVQCNMKKYLI